MTLTSSDSNARSVKDSSILFSESDEETKDDQVISDYLHIYSLTF